ncbi:MAG: polysaccharide deacetylase, partial [Erysipelotrichia bacterium]|nr:polysaccharide deacetylase [Erysipelotrichia bacterium]
IYYDTKKSFDIFEKEMGFKPKGYSYPYGEYDDRVKNIIKKFDFNYIANQNNGSINENSDIFDLNRVALVGKVDLKEKLKYKTLEVDWIEPQFYPKDGILTKVSAKVNPEIKNAKLFISTYGWQDIKVKNGIIDIKLDKKLNLNRNRVAISTDYYTISNKLLIK